MTVPVAFSPIEWTPSGVRILDQSRLPEREVYVEIRGIDPMAEAIRSLRVRGAPLIGIAAAMGVAAAAEAAAAEGSLTPEWLASAVERLRATRPTAVNLRWALDRMQQRATGFAGRSWGRDVSQALRDEAQRIWDIEAGMCVAIGQAGADLIAPGSTVLTHCNTGRLATGGLGTALAVISEAHTRGMDIDVVVTETRPLRQGARLTAWELARLGIPGRVIVDGAAAALMAKGDIDVVITGADRIAANGDVANKIGTYALAVLADAHGIPFYVAAPLSTFDTSLPAGEAIPIEERGPEEIGPAPGTPAFNPAFDVTPASLIAGIVTDRGVLRPPLDAAIAAVVH